MLTQRDVHQGAQAPFGEPGRKQRDRAADDPLLAQPPQPPRDGRRRQGHDGGELVRGAGIVALDFVQQGPVEGIEHPAPVPKFGTRRIKIAQTGKAAGARMATAPIADGRSMRRRSGRANVHGAYRQ